MFSIGKMAKVSSDASTTDSDDAAKSKRPQKVYKEKINEKNYRKITFDPSRKVWAWRL